MSCDRPRNLPRHPIGELDHVAHVGRLDHVAMVRIAVAEVIEQIDIGRHAVAEIDQDIGERLLHLRLAAAVARRLVAFEPGEHGGGDVELDRQFVVRDGGGDLVDLALERVVVERVDRRMQRIDQEQPDHRMRRHQIDLEFGAGGNLAGVFQRLEHGIRLLGDVGIEQIAEMNVLRRASRV